MPGHIADGKAIYVVQKDPEYGTAIEWIVGYESPVKLSLVTRDHRAIVRAHETHQQGANLVICMEKEAALSLFSQIRALAQTMGWPLPKEDDQPSWSDRQERFPKAFSKLRGEQRH